jgi:hypothetical protein
MYETIIEYNQQLIVYPPITHYLKKGRYIKLLSSVAIAPIHQPNKIEPLLKARFHRIASNRIVQLFYYKQKLGITCAIVTCAKTTEEFVKSKMLVLGRSKK